MVRMSRSNRKVLVTGANGQLGNEMRVVAESSEDQYIFTDVAELDITDFDAISKLVKKSKIDVIVNCAAYTNVERAEDEPEQANLINNIAVGYLAKAAAENNATLIHISTDYVFDGKANTPYTEECETNPIGVYGSTKLAGEQSIIESGCNYIILRTSWLYSKWGKNFIKTIKSKTEIYDVLPVVFDQVGTPTYAGDLAKSIGLIISADQLDNKGIYHYSNQGVCSWYDFAKMFCRLSQIREDIHPVTSDCFPTKVARPHYSVMDKTKFIDTFLIRVPYWTDSLLKCIAELESDDANNEF